jgi:tetratricopeptide (TPR) repeat protein
MGGYDRSLRALAALGRMDEIEALLDTVLAQPDRAVGVPPLRASIILAYELRAHGFEEPARSAAQRGLAWIETRPPEEVREEPSGYRAQRTELLHFLGRWEEALDLREQLLAEVGEVAQVPAAPLASLAGEAARLGDVERARSISTELAGRIEEVQHSGLDLEGVMVAELLLHRARISAVLGEREQAVRFLEEAFRLTRHKGPLAYEIRHWTDLNLLYDYLPFQEFVKPRG